MIATGAIYVAAALAEIAGCFSFWAAWLWAVEGVRPDRYDVAGAGLCLIGAAVILFGRTAFRGP